MMHVPLIYRYPAPSRRGGVPTSGQQLRFPADRARLPRHERQDAAEAELARPQLQRTLNGRPVAWDDTVFFEFENTWAIRTREWKYVGRFPDGPNELYDLKSDPEERHNLVDQPDRCSGQKSLHGRLNEFFATYADPPIRFEPGRPVEGRSTHKVASQSGPVINKSSPRAERPMY